VPTSAHGWSIPTVRLQATSFSILSLKHWGYPDLTSLSSCTVLSQEEIDGFVGRLFDKDSPTVRLANLPLRYSSETPLLR
jgi:hypothetical protein